MSDTLSEKREELSAKRDLYKTIFEEAAVEGEDGKRDFTQVECLGTAVNALEGAEKAKRVAEIAAELKDAITDLDVEISTAEASADFDSTEQHFKNQRKRQPFASGSAATKDHGRKLNFDQIVKRIVDDETFKAWQRGSKDGRIEIDALWSEAKTLADPFSTTDGFPPEVTRNGVLVDTRLAPLSLSDIVPRGRTGQNSVAFMQQTVRSNAAAEVAEGAIKAESDAQFAEATVPVREIATWIPVTDIVLEDAPFVASVLESQLRGGVAKRLDTQIMSGDGVSPNFTGIRNTAGVQAFNGALNSDAFQNLMEAGSLIQTGAAFAEPTHLIISAGDWVTLANTKITDGRFLIGNPQDMTARRVWGWPVILSHELATGEALLGSFAADNIQLIERRGISVERGLTGDQFIRDQQTLRATVRMALAVYRPAAFVSITDLFGTA